MTPVYSAAESNETTAVITTLLNAGADVNARDNISWRTQYARVTLVGRSYNGDGQGRHGCALP